MLPKHLLPIEEDKEPIEFAKKQLSIFWQPDEINVGKDIQDILTNFTEAERHAVISTLKLFSIYETHAGDEFWGRRFKEIFDGAEYHRMASVFSMFELAVHGPFYNEINKLLNINTPEFYLSYQDNPVLVQRVKHIGEMIDHEDDLVALGSFSLVEGAVLYSQFAFLLHFQSQGKNKLMNVDRGILFSVKDENIHSVAGAWCFKRLVQKRGLTVEQLSAVEEKIRQVARTIVEHERQIIEIMFEKGKIEGITAHQLDNFVQVRVNRCLAELGFKKEYEVTYDPISPWFNKAINDYSFNDFFSGLGNQYNRNWSEFDFKWSTEE
jgi:ribonucleoside-diphosphate reductase beta chain